MAVFNTKKLLSKAGFHEFAPGVEGFSEASPRFLADLRRFQTAHDLAPDATAQPGGPTVHMLTRKVFGPADGPPPESESEHFLERFGADPNRTLSGQPIFGGPGGGYIEAGGTEIQQAAWRGGRGGQLPGGKRARKWIDDLIRRGLRSPSSRSPKRWPETNEPVIGETPVTIFRYPDGRLYLPVGKDGEISVSRREPGSVSFEPVMNQVQVAGMRAAFHKNYPNLDDRTSFEERHAHGKESYVYGPAYDENGKLTGYLPLRDPVTDRALRIPVGRERYLTDAQIRAMGLQQWQTKPKPSR
jgi:hypothetical protein